MAMEPDEKWKILLVDDEADIRDVLFLALTDYGYEVHTAENGENALKIFQDVTPPIVITDIKMPGIDGIELLRRIKRLNPEAEVVMITGHGDMELAIESLKHEATDFITKPIDVNALKIALSRVHDKIIMKQKLREYTESLETLIREKIELQDRLSSLGLMIGSISHGIKGLLANLDAGVYLLDSGYAKDKRDRIGEGLDIIKLVADRIKRLVLDILFYAKERELKREPVDILAFADDLADALEQKIAGKPIDVIRDFANAPESFGIDAEYLRAALVNILDNAVDACAADTEKQSHKIVFGAKTDGPDLVLDIRDNGTGMDDETRERVFTLFFSSKGSKGTGFGLFISNTIVSQHGGTINVDSAKGKGTHFCIRIPGKTEK